MRVAVTGASGLIGANILRAAVERGHDVLGIAREGSNCAGGELRGVRIERADILQPHGSLRAAFEGAEAVIHTAAAFSYQLEAKVLHELAVRGTRAVVEAAADAGARRVVVTSSSVVFGHSHGPEPRSETHRLANGSGEPPYVAAKVAQDREALDCADKRGLELVLACPTMSIGPTAAALGPSNGLVLAYLSDKTRSTYPGGCNIVSAADVGNAHVLLAERGAHGEHYLLGSENMLWSEIHEEIGYLTGVGGPRYAVSPSLAWLAASAEELTAKVTGRAPLTTRFQAGMLGRFYWYDDSKARALGYAPRPATEALLRCVSWLVASRHVSRELRTGIRLADDVHRLRYNAAAT